MVVLERGWLVVALVGVDSSSLIDCGAVRNWFGAGKIKWS